LFHPSLYKGREDVEQGAETDVKQLVEQLKRLIAKELIPAVSL
jgi:hypothetical protein